jgi:RNA polymerase sigma-70 factor (ECF subfamily)
MSLEKGNDTELIDGALAGDADAFAELFNRYYSMIYAFAYRLCFDKADAQDVAQETFVKAARSLASFRGQSSFRQWLYRIALNASHDSNRNLNRKARLSAALVGARDISERRVDYTGLQGALEELSEDLRETVTLVFFEGMNHAEAAQILGCAETTVSWRVFRAKRKLKRLLESNL